MMMYMNGFGAEFSSPESSSTFFQEVERLEETYTNYGCYCWIDGAESGVLGGGKTKETGLKFDEGDFR